MFYVIYVLAILCGTAFCLKVHTPPMGMAVANENVTVSWSRQADSDPTSVLFLLENLIGGGNLIQGGISNWTGTTNKTSTKMKFPDVGTCRMWAVNPSNATESYAMSQPFTVTPNNLAVAAGPGNVGNDDDESLSLLPPASPSGSAVSQHLSVPTNTSSLAASSSPSKTKPSITIIVAASASGVLLLALLACALIYILRRRKARVERRTTFHRTRMVKSLPPPTFAVPPHDSDAELDSDVEEGAGGGKRYGKGSRVRYMEERERPPPGPYPFARTA